MFFIPEGASELEYTTDSINVEIIEGADEADAVESANEFEVDFSEFDEIDHTGDTPDVPLINGIASQTVHRTNVGNEVVDVVLDVDDIDGVTSYEFRVTKI